MEEACVQARRKIALTRTEVAVSGAEGEAVRRPGGGYPLNAYRNGEVGNHFLDDQQLLQVFFTEQGNVWLDEIQQFTDHGGDAVKMSRPVPSAEYLCQTGYTHSRVGPETLGIQRVDVGGEQEVGARLGQ